MNDLPHLLAGVLGLLVLAALLWWFDGRAAHRRRHHDHLNPGTPRSPRRAP